MDTDTFERQTSLQTNLMFILALALDLLVRDNDRRMRVIGGMLNEKSRMCQTTKMRFGEYSKAVKRACTLNEQITQQIYDVDERYNFKNVRIWQEEANELARVMLLFADKSTEDGARERIQAYIRSFKGEGLVDEDFLKPFYLK